MSAWITIPAHLETVHAEILPIDYMAITSLDDVMRLFLSEQLAVYWGGSWNNKEMARSATFEYGSDVLTCRLSPKRTSPARPVPTYRSGRSQLEPGSMASRRLRQKGENFDLADRLFEVDIRAAELRTAGEKTSPAFIPMVAGTEVGPVLANFQMVAAAALTVCLSVDPDGRMS